MSDARQSNAVSPGEAMISKICGAWVAKAIHAVVMLGIPDMIGDKARSSAELAAVTRSDPDSLHRLLRALAAEGVLEIDAGGRFALTPVGATLRRDVPGSLYPWAKLMLGEVHQAAWDELLDGVRTGESAFGRRHGSDLWSYSRSRPEHAALFGAAMAAFTEGYVAAVLAACPFAHASRIVDVGGGDGRLLIAILGATPETSGIVFELPATAEVARRRIAEAGLGARCAVVAGDALVEEVPPGDTCILSRVLHDWDDAHAVRFLAACRDALTPGGRVLVIERIVPEGPVETAALRPALLSDIMLTDLNMMVMTSGRERTLAEYRALAARAGLHVERVVPTGTAVSVIELRAPMRNEVTT